MYTALYRSHRPEVFDEILGQEHVVKILKNQVASGSVSHAYLFCGTRGTGKTTTARILAKAVNCLSESDRPCGECEHCIAIKEGNFIDVMEIDAASNNGVENIRELRESVKYPPAAGRRKVYIIDEVHMLSTGAFNALLKTLEEPPEPVSYTHLDVYKRQELILAAKENIKIPVHLHSHCTSGIAPMTYMKAIDAGCDAVDTAISPFSMGTSQPSTEAIAKVYEGTERDPGLNQNLIADIADYFRKLMDRFIAEGRVNPKAFSVDYKILKYKVPGGMLSNLMLQLEEQKMMDRFYEVMEEIPRIREDFGQPPLVTPICQIVGTQAVLNVLLGERYQVMPSEAKALLHGDYGKTIKDFSAVVQRKAIGDEKPVTVRPADLIEPELSKLERDLAGYKTCDEDVLTYAMFPQVAMNFFKERKAREGGEDPDLYDPKNK